MPVNYNLVDPTEGMNRGLGTLAQALQYRQQMERQATQDAMTAKSHGLQNTLSQMGIDKITAEQGALMSATGQPDLQSALGAQLKAKTEGEAQKLQAEKLARYSAVLEHLSKAPFDDATKAQYLKAAIGKDPDFADFVKTMSIQSQPNPSDYSLEKQYGPGGATKIVPVSKTKGLIPESGWTFAPPLKPDTISPAAEAQQVRIAKAKAKEGQPHIAVYTDKANGQKHVVDLKNPAHKRWLRKYGPQLIREGANPIADAMFAPAGNQAGKKYKTPDEVRASFKAGKIDEDEAADILRADFGMK